MYMTIKLEREDLIKKTLPSNKINLSSFKNTSINIIDIRKADRIFFTDGDDTIELKNKN